MRPAHVLWILGLIACARPAENTRVERPSAAPAEPRPAETPTLAQTLDCDDEDGSVCLARGREAKSARMWELAGRYFEASCELGHGEGCGELASALLRGRGVTEDPERATAIAHRGCDGTRTGSCVVFAWMLERGYADLEPDPQRAAEIYARGCGGGDSLACYNAGNVFWHGRRGVTRAPQRAVRYLQMGCRLEEAVACSMLLTVYEATDPAPDEASIVAEFATSCEEGSATACTALGLAHQFGRGIAKDIDRADHLYGRACALQDAAGCAVRAALVESGLLGSPNRARAGALYRSACDYGDAYACLSAGVRVERPEEALDLFERGCQGSIGPACFEAGVLLEQQGSAAANEHFRRGCETGHAESCTRQADD
ncbi:MAG: sel1 repeat family protein [Deltaproteobacteria bacterium]|nr:sel1 repeat family protein [Deltaproteobacteria bacterium]